MKPYYEHAGITIYHGDCREILPRLEPVDLVLADPPYGMNNNTDSSRFRGGHGGHRASIAKGGTCGRFKGKITGDDKPFNPRPWLAYNRVILFGSNHFAAALPVGTTLVWIKRFDTAFGTFLSDAEIAWMKGGHGVYCHRDLSMTASAINRFHPNQKPIGLMKWCIEKSKTTGPIVDPYMGSGTTLVAAKELGRQAIGIEIEERYCEIAARRLSQEVLPLG